MTKPNKIYLAYGSNLNLAQMVRRCPDAIPMGWMELPDYRLIFKGVADIIPAKGFTVPVGLWSITEKCERALDRYEGYPSLYRKQYFQLEEDTLMAYVMNDHGIQSPSRGYFDSIEEGYNDFGIDTAPLYEALHASAAKDTGEGYIPQRYRMR